MKFEKIVEGIGTFHSLKRFASAYVVDHTKLSEAETIEALKKTAPQYSYEPNVRKSLESCLMHPDRDVRTVTPIFLREVLLNCDQFTSADKDTDEAVINWEQSIIDNSNESLSSKRSSRSQVFELFEFIVKTAWENNDSISVDEKNLIEKVREKLLVSEREYRTIEACLGKFPRHGNAIHTRAEIDEVRKKLQSAGLVASIRDNNRVDYDIIPDEIAVVVRKILGREIRRYGYTQLLNYKHVKRKEWLVAAIQKIGLVVDGAPSVDDLKEIVIERVKPSILIGGVSPKDGLAIDTLKSWCSEIRIPTSGTKGELIDRIVTFYDSLVSRQDYEEDPRELWYEHYEKLASRDRDFLRSQQIIDKDLGIESRFEAATNYLFEIKLGHKPLKLVATEHADGMLSHGDALILWDNKSKESDVSLSAHIKQFDRYISQQEKRVSGFIVIGPSFTEDSAAVAMRYQVEKGTSIALITASEIKSLADEWKVKDQGAFPLGYLVLPGRFRREVVPV